MVAAIDLDAERTLRHEIVINTRGAFVATAAAFNGGDSFDAMQAWIEAVGDEPDGELPYELDPNARPDANFMAMMARTQEDGGGMGVQRVKAGQELPPQFADMAPMMARLQELEAAKAN